MSEDLKREEILQEADAFNLRQKVKDEGYILYVGMGGGMSLTECYDAVFLDMTNQIG